MPNLTPYPLRFSGGLHVGTRGVNLEEAGLSIPSDTLYAAVLDALRRSGVDLDAFARAYFADPPFLLTSAFPFAGDVRFYPMPADIARRIAPDAAEKYGKRLGRIRYLSEGLLNEILSKGRLDGWLFPESETETPKTGVTLQGHALWMKVDEIARLPKQFQRSERQRHALPRLIVWKTARVPRVAIDRTTSASNIFQAGKVEFAEGCGLWFGVHWRRPDAQFDGTKFQDVFTTAMNILKADGLGGERTMGYGSFRFEAGQSVSWKDAQAGEMAYLLSRYHPRSEETLTGLNDPQAAYHLTPVAGWLRTFDGAAQRRKRVFLVEEGSLVRAGEGVMGEAVDVRPVYESAPGVPHPVYRVGLALTLAWPSEGGSHA
jgi:CRISPR-associated protein Csm4